MWSRQRYNIFNKNGWNVLSIDKEDTGKFISSKLNEEEIKKDLDLLDKILRILN